MSMISSQCDKLRETADEIQRIKNNNADWLWRDCITLADAVEQMREAADLISELRDDLQRANAAVQDAEHDESMAWDRVRKAEADNVKLRELLEATLQCAGETKRDKGCDACPMYNGPWRNDGTWCLLRSTLRELGMEAD